VPVHDHPTEPELGDGSPGLLDGRGGVLGGQAGQCPEPPPSRPPGRSASGPARPPPRRGPAARRAMAATERTCRSMPASSITRSRASPTSVNAARNPSGAWLSGQTRSIRSAGIMCSSRAINATGSLRGVSGTAGGSGRSDHAPEVVGPPVCLAGRSQRFPPTGARPPGLPWVHGRTG
jgi:hypothetical protein